MGELEKRSGSYMYVYIVLKKKREKKKRKRNTFGIIGQRGTNTSKLYSS